MNKYWNYKIIFVFLLFFILGISPVSAETLKWKKIQTSCNAVGDWTCIQGTGTGYVYDTEDYCINSGGCDVKWKTGTCNTTTGNYTCSSGTDSYTYTFTDQNSCITSPDCDVATPTTKWKVTIGSCNTSTGNYTCTSGTIGDYTDYNSCIGAGGCEVVATLTNAECLTQCINTGNCNSQDYCTTNSTGNCVASGCIGSVSFGVCNCTPACQTSCSGTWYSSVPSGSTITATSGCNCDNGGSCYQYSTPVITCNATCAYPKTLTCSGTKSLCINSQPAGCTANFNCCNCVAPVAIGCLGDYACEDNNTCTNNKCNTSTGQCSYPDNGSCVTPTPLSGTCITTCPLGKTHITECPAVSQSNCSAIAQPAGCNDTYTCCDCTLGFIPPTCTPNCSCAATTLVGTNCSNGCGGYCAGTKVATTPPGTGSNWGKVSCDTTTGNYNCQSCTASVTCTFTSQSECAGSYGCDVGSVTPGGGVCTPATCESLGYSRFETGCGYVFPYPSNNCGGFLTAVCNYICATPTAAPTSIPCDPAMSCPTCRTSSSTVSNGFCGINNCDINCWTTCVGNVCNSPPVIDNLVIKNNLGSPVPTETGSKNQICQSGFNDIDGKNSRRVTFEVSAHDPDGINDIANITVTWNGRNLSRGAIGSVTTFGGIFDSTWNNSVTYPLIIKVTDSQNQSVNASPRSFKIWDCNVSVSGSIYNNSDGSIEDCSTPLDQAKKISENVNFTSLTFVDASGNKSMTITQQSSYNNGSNPLLWGKNYGYAFNSGLAVTDLSMKVNGFNICQNTVNLANNPPVDPYASNPSVTADFIGVADQDPWWQASGGGVISNIQVSNQVPVTCATNCEISLSGLVSAPTVSNDGSRSIFQTWSYQNPLAKLTDVNKNYSYFYKQYLVKSGVGTTLIGNKNITDIGSTGIYFVNGNLTIDSNKIINPGDFLMIIVNGNIGVSNTVTRVDGILVANNITASGSNNTQLVFNGSLFASGTINFSRDYTVKSTNNTVPAVKVNYNPGLMFKIPGKVAQILSNWQWGN